MRERLEAFMKLCEDYERDHLQTTDYTFRKQKLSDEMASQEPTVKEILKRLDPKLAESGPNPITRAVPTTRCGQSRRAWASCATRTSGKPTLRQMRPRSLPTNSIHMSGRRSPGFGKRAGTGSR
jgi:hypothetical protein